ncbi:ABC transporter permease subunit [bacterium]|nr:ABC transporter permease subunit [bacterium]
MSSVRVILRKELLTYFNSPIAYVFLTVFLILSGWLFSSGMFLRGEASVSTFIEIAPLLFLFFIPSITMRLFSEELSRGTFEVLATLPVRDGEIVLGKFLAAATLLASALAATLVFPVSVSFAGDVDGGRTLASYGGLGLMGLAFLSMGAFASSVTQREILAFIVGFLIMMAFFLAGKFTVFFPPAVSAVLDFIGVDSHIGNISRGVVDTRDVIYFLTLTGFFLYLTAYSLGSRRWK